MRYLPVFSRKDSKFMVGFPHLNGCGIMIRDNRDNLEGPKVADEAVCRSRIIGEPVAEPDRQ
jgi:hypothetical protein